MFTRNSGEILEWIGGKAAVGKWDGKRTQSKAFMMYTTKYIYEISPQKKEEKILSLPKSNLILIKLLRQLA